MPDFDGAVAIEEPLGAEVTETVEQPVDNAVEGTQPVEQTDKVDGRQRPDALRKWISDQRKAADSVTDPVQKKALLDTIKGINDRIGKNGAYEQLFPTVKEAREFKALLDTVGGRDGLSGIQQRIAGMEEIDSLLERGDPAVLDKLWAAAKDGIPKLIPHLVDRLAKESPEAYSALVTPHAIKFFDQSGFPEAFDQMVRAFKAGKNDEGHELAGKLASWYSGQRQNAGKQAEAKPDPERTKFEQERKTFEETKRKEQTDAAYNSVIQHAGPAIDKHLKPLVAKLGLSPEQYSLLREDVWKDLQGKRNADATYKTVAGSKWKQGPQDFVQYANEETESRAKDSAEHVAKLRYGHQLKAGSNGNGNGNATATKPPGAGVTRGQQPSPDEIDYSPKGKLAAQKAGFRDLQDMILAGQAPLIVGGIRKWR